MATKKKPAAKPSNVVKVQIRVGYHNTGYAVYDWENRGDALFDFEAHKDFEFEFEREKEVPATKLVEVK